MAKKQKRNLQKLITKKQQIQQLTQGPVISFTASAEPSYVGEQVMTAAQPNRPSQSATVAAGPGRELRKTAISIVLIALLLTLAVITDHKTPYFNHFGDWLYRTLRLQS